MPSPDELAAVRDMLIELLPRLQRFALGLCRSRDDADDLVQATYERALSRLHQWQPGSRLDSWMYRIAQSIYFNRLKAEKVRRGYLQQQVDLDDHAVDGDAQAENALMLERLRHHVADLPDEQRVCLLLIVVEGLSYLEASKVLDLPIGTITSRLGRARIALRERLQHAASDCQS
ncbi:MAG: RNA polymerase sigma factor [Gammaproteobacteria bacterium]|nr:RNA polymerase sigma factor [Gammaproteobacteria bacterium]